MTCIGVGGGVIGTSIAWHLSQRAVGDVVLLERDRLGSGTTWHSAGNITWRPMPDYDAPILYALETIARLDQEGEQATGWLKTGRTFLARSEATLRHFEAFDKIARERGIDARLLEPEEARMLNPLLGSERLSGIWLNPLSGRLNPADLTMAYAKAARARGARIRENVEVRRISLQGGRVVGVETDDGFVAADLVVIAAGLWSRGLLEEAGIYLAQWPCQHFYVIAETSPRLARSTPSFVSPDDLLYGREEVGNFLVGFFDENANTIAPGDLPKPFAFTLLPPDWDKIAPYFDRAVQLFPALEHAPIRHFVNGPESFTPDGMPLIGRLPQIDGLFVATAMNSAGVTWSAMTGHLIADLVAGEAPRFAAERHDPTRFGAQARDLEWLKAKVSAAVSQGYRAHNT
jgi:glycine/D-amino acid oxidase-like deaminating enzyme